MKKLLILLLSFLIIACSEQESQIDSTNILKKGQDIANKAQAVLATNLVRAIQSQGTEAALAFCSERAISLTDSMALALNAKIKRVSDRNRNVGNAASQSEVEFIQGLKEALSAQKELKPKLIETDKGYKAFYPILTNPLCLQCHGDVNKEIRPETLSKIAELYPYDKAVNYSANEIRGLWVVEMGK